MSAADIATTFEGERKLYNAVRMRLLSAYPPSVFLLLADGGMLGVFPAIKEADEHARLQRFTSWIVKSLGDVTVEHEVPSP
ncbi:MAG TPA: hypothetical protein VKZ50_08795 [bacterium]|nr:hypothetical protein [bacterium]